MNKYMVRSLINLYKTSISFCVKNRTKIAKVHNDFTDYVTDLGYNKVISYDTENFILAHFCDYIKMYL